MPAYRVPATILSELRGCEGTLCWLSHLSTVAHVNGVRIVSGMAIATGDSCIKHRETPALNAVPLTESLSPRHWSPIFVGGKLGKI